MLTLSLPLYGSEIDAGGLLEAASKGDLERVREFLTKNPDLLNGTGNGGTPLCAATFLARKEVIELLLSKGANVNLPTHQYFVPKGDDNQMPKPLSVTPLHLAAYQGYAEIAKILLAAKANPTAKTEDGTTPLHTAAACGRAEVVKVLIDGKADLNARDKDEATPVHYAAALGRPEIYAALVAAGADVDAVAQK